MPGKMRSGMFSTTREAIVWNETIKKEQKIAEKCRTEYFDKEEVEWKQREQPLRSTTLDVQLPTPPEKKYHVMKPKETDIPEKPTLFGLTRIDKERPKAGGSFHFMKHW